MERYKLPSTDEIVERYLNLLPKQRCWLSAMKKNEIESLVRSMKFAFENGVFGDVYTVTNPDTESNYIGIKNVETGKTITIQVFED